MLKPDRILVATVSEDKPLARLEVELLFRTFRRCGGTLARARCAAKFVGSADRATTRRLDALGVAVDVVRRVDPRSPHANKIRMLEGVGDVDLLVALDNDVAVARDFSCHLDPGRVGAKPEDLDPLTLTQWARLFAHFGLALPPERFRTTFNWTETVPYFNTGVLLLPGRHIGAIHDSWSVQVCRLLDSAEALPEVAKWRIYQEQIAFALALADTRAPFHPLPLEANFPTHAPVHPAWSPDAVDPALIHHHHRLWSDGRIMPTGYAGADARIAALNESLADALREAVLDALPGGDTAGVGDGRPVPFPGTWWAQIETFRARIERAVPRGEEFLLVDDQQFGPSVAGDRVARPFPEFDGQFAGLPADDAHAIADLQRLRRLGARWLVILKPAFWWLDHYRGLSTYLAEHCACVSRNEHLVVFRLDGRS